MIRFRTLCLAGALLLGACAQVQETLSNATGGLTGTTTPEFTPRFIALIEAEVPTLQVSFVDQDLQSALLLEQQRAGLSYWLSSDGGMLITQNGMLHGMRGLAGGLLASDLSAPLALVLRGQEGVADRFHTFLDGNDRAVARTYRCTITARGPRDVNLGARTAKTQLMRESCRSLDQTFANQYWVETARGEIVQSRQWSGDFLGYIATRVVAN
jgi:hypothetical protein